MGVFIALFGLMALFNVILFPSMKGLLLAFIYAAAAGGVFLCDRWLERHADAMDAAQVTKSDTQ